MDDSLSAQEFIKTVSELIQKDGVLPELGKGLLNIDPTKHTTHTIKADNNFFKVDFVALDLDKNRCVINAARIHDGLLPKEGRFGER